MRLKEGFPKFKNLTDSKAEYSTVDVYLKRVFVNLNAHIFVTFLIITILLSPFLIENVSSKSTPGPTDDPIEYLTNFGYLSRSNTETGELRSADEVIEAVKAFQKMAGLPENGDMNDKDTMRKMMSERCGFVDVVRPENIENDYSSGGPAKYELSTKWQKTSLTYNLQNHHPNIKQDKIAIAIEEAFALWAAKSPLRFNRVEARREADIDMYFASFEHGDGYSFDGPGRVLAHAFPPGDGIGGDVHFDAHENWNFKSEGTDLYTVAAHEIGHSLGILHSQDQRALMYPFYRGYDSKMQLGDDDIRAIQALYGPNQGIPRSGQSTTVRSSYRTPSVVTKSSKKRPIPTSPPGYDGKPNPCNTNIDAISSVRGETFVFKGKWFWRHDRHGLMDGYPVKIEHFWRGLPKNLDSIDAMYERKEDNKIIFFKGKRYWEFDGITRAPGFPEEGRPLTDMGICPKVEKIDAAMVWGYNKRTYLFSNRVFWRMENKNGKKVEPNYPKTFDMWQGLPKSVDAAFTDHKGDTYFFKDTLYYKMDDKKMKVHKGFPRDIGQYWLRCAFSYTANDASVLTLNPHTANLVASILISLLIGFSVQLHSSI